MGLHSVTATKRGREGENVHLNETKEPTVNLDFGRTINNVYDIKEIDFFTSLRSRIRPLFGF